MPLGTSKTGSKCQPALPMEPAGPKHAETADDDDDEVLFIVAPGLSARRHIIHY
jgi:hypothetical protein